MLETGRLLLEQGHEVPLVVTAKEAPEYDVSSNDFKSFAKEIGATFFHSAKINTTENIEIIKQQGTLDIACSINYSGIIAQEVIDLFALGILNAHAGDLPRYRGNAVLAWAIANMEERIGLCIHSMIGGELDSGPIIARIYRKISDDTKIGQLYDWMYTETPGLFCESVSKLVENDDYRLEVQSTAPKDILRCYPREQEDGKICWQTDARTILRLINASGEPFYGAYTFLNGEEIRILDAEVVSDSIPWLGTPGQVSSINEDGSIEILCKDSKLRVKTIKNRVGETLQPSDIIKSIRTRLRS